MKGDEISYALITIMSIFGNAGVVKECKYYVQLGQCKGFVPDIC